jgi:formyl-CoA transferase
LNALEWLDEPDYASEADRSIHRDRLNAAINERTAQDSTANWVQYLNDAGVPCGEVLTIDQAFANPQVAHLGLVQAVQSKRLGELNLVGQPIHLSRTPSQLNSAPPERGEHSEEILLEMGFDQEEIALLQAQGVI